MTHTEKVHVILGMMAAATGALAFWSAYRPGSRLRFVWPWIGFAIGFFLFIPLERGSRTYQEVGWWDTMMSVWPSGPRWYVEWFRYLNEWHVVQHKLGALLIMAVAVIEFRRARSTSPGRWESWVTPILVIGIGLLFGMHGGSSEHLPYRSEQFSHHLLGLAFVGSGVALGLSRAGRLRHPAWAGLWALLIMAVGLELAFFYRLTPEERSMPAVHHVHPATP